MILQVLLSIVNFILILLGLYWGITETSGIFLYCVVATLNVAALIVNLIDIHYKLVVKHPATSATTKG